MLPSRTFHLTTSSALKQTLRATSSSRARFPLASPAPKASSPFTAATALNHLHTRHFSASAAVKMSRLADVITQDHRDLEEAYNHIINGKTDDEKKRWQNQFTWELARHSLGEELIVYPQFERKLPNGKEMADKDRQQHLTLKEHLYKFQSMKTTDPDFIPTIKSLWADLEQHIKEEEEHDLVALEERLDEADSQKLIKEFRLTKKFVPTQSHPSAPDKPPFETVAGLMAAPFDHIKDIFKKFPKEAKSELPP